MDTNTSISKNSNRNILGEDTFIVAIGASAGGLKALRDFFEYAEPAKNIAYIVIQHLPTDYKSMMPELLSRHAKMPVHTAKHNQTVKPNNVYLMPNQYDMTIKYGKLQLLEKKADRRLNLPIDRFFQSLAIDQKAQAVGVILSGTGSDGTFGMAAIKDYGGLLLVQSPESAEFGGMPSSVIQAGLTDYILAPQDMYKELIESINHPDIARVEQEMLFEGQTETVFKILSLIKSMNGKDFIYYKRPTIHRSIAKRMGMLGIDEVESYLNFLIKNDDEVEVLAQQFLIGTTRFFRDEPVFALLSQEVFPELFKQTEGNDFVKIWLIGCSTGEEVYSLAMLLNEYAEEQKVRKNFRIFATDINQKAIATAKKGIYSESSVKDIPEHLLKRYFKQEGKNFVVGQTLRSSLIFAPHDVTKDAPYSSLNLVICRNMLIYMQPVLQKKVLTIIQFSLKFNGYMLLGNSESAQELNHAFQIISIKWKLYKNVDASKQLILQKTNTLHSYAGATKVQPIHPNIRKSKVTFELICMALLQDSQAACVLIDTNYNILEALGQYKEYLSFSENKLVLNLLKMVSPEFSAVIVATISKVKKENEAAAEKKIRIIREGRTKFVKILVKPLLINPLNREEGYLIVFNDDKTNDTSGSSNIPSTISAPEIKIMELESELIEYKKTLQAIMEEVDTSNEELKAINEELFASNEELQSANEELISMNAEFQAKNEELNKINKDLEYFMKNAQIGTFLLDEKLVIRRYNSSIKTHFNFMRQDIGRSINDFKDGEIIAQEARQVLKTGLSQIKELEKDDRWFQRKIAPYIIEGDKIEGIVVTYLDLTEARAKQKALQQSEQQLRLALKENSKIVEGLGEAKRMLEKMIQVVPGIVHIFNLDNLSSEYTSNEIGTMLGYSRGEIKDLRSSVMAQLVHPDDVPRMMKDNDIIKSMKDNEVNRFEYRIKHKNGKYRWFLSLVSIFERNKEGEVSKYIGFGLDITDIKNAQADIKTTKDLADTKRMLEKMIQVMPGVLHIFNLETMSNEYSNKELATMLGYNTEEIQNMGDNIMVKITHPEDLSCMVQELEIIKNMKDGEVNRFEHRIKHKNGMYRRLLTLVTIFERNEQGEVSKYIGFALDVTDMKANS